MSYGLSAIEIKAFEQLRPWLCENHGTFDMNLIETNGQLVRAEKKAIMAILLSLDQNEFIFDYWSMGTFMRIILERLLEFGRILLDSQETGKSILGADIFSGEVYTEEKHGTVFVTTDSGAKLEYLGNINSWAYHLIVNGPFHPATREPIKYFSIKSMDEIKELPKCLRLSRSERLTLASALKLPRTEAPQISRDQILEFEFEFSVPEERSFYNFHGGENDMPPLIHAVPNAQAHFVGPLYVIHNNAALHQQQILFQTIIDHSLQQDVFLYEEE